MKKEPAYLRDNPKLMAEWDWEKNEKLGLDPFKLRAYSHKEAYWKCEKGHSWPAPIYSRTAGNGCSVCAGKTVLKGYNDLATKNPELAEEWHPTKNGNLTPFDVVPGCNKEVWWKCKVCGHEWMREINHRNRGSGCQRCAGQVVLLGINDLATLYPNLVEEWHPTKNKKPPSEYLPQANKRVYWKCKSCGHEWSAFIYSRTGKIGSGCPKCAEKLHTSFPEQAIYYYLKQIDTSVKNREMVHGMELDIYLPSLNTAVEYDGEYYHSSSKAKARDELKAQILKELGIRLIRVRDSKSLKNEIQISDDLLTIPHKNAEYYLNDVIQYLIRELFGKSLYRVDVIHDRQKILESYKLGFRANSLKEKYPELAKQWHPTKNGELSPESFSHGSHEYVWWKCSVCGHEWRAQIKSRVTGSGCRVCAGKDVKIGYNDLATTHPELAKQWHPTKNGTLTPYDVTKGSKKDVYWLCENGHDWKRKVSYRTGGGGRGCPYCANKLVWKGFNDLATVHPELADEWHPTKNEKKPDEMVYGSSKDVWWKCSVCGYEWSAKIGTRHKGHGCPECAKKKRIESLSKRNSNKK